MELVCWISETCLACPVGLVEGQFVLDVRARWVSMQSTGKEEETRETSKKSRSPENNQKKEIKTINN